MNPGNGIETWDWNPWICAGEHFHINESRQRDWNEYSYFEEAK